MHSETDELRKKYNAEGTELRSLQMQMLDILEIVTAICDKHDIPYWISGGTLLGAKRHGGFIPWDDDIDIELLRKDYKKLLKILPSELPSNLYLQTPKEKSYRLFFSKVRDRFSVVSCEEDDMARYDVKGIFIDLFHLEPGYSGLKSVVDFFYGRSFRRLKRGRPCHSPKYFLEFSVSLLMYPIGWSLAWMARGISAITKPKNIVYAYGITVPLLRPLDSVFPLGEIEFEGRKFSAPGQLDAYLRLQYGNYMRIPPEDKRETHFMRVTYLN